MPKIGFEKAEFNIGEYLIGVYVINLNWGIPLKLSSLEFAQIQILQLHGQLVKVVLSFAGMPQIE